MAKEVIDTEVKLYCNYEAAVLDLDPELITIEVEGGLYPHSVTRTVIKDRYSLTNIGPSMSIVGADNLGTARFQLTKIERSIPVKPYTFLEDVYIFESFLQ